MIYCCWLFPDCSTFSFICASSSSDTLITICFGLVLFIDEYIASEKEDLESYKADLEEALEELKDMRADWKPEKEPNMNEEIELIKKWVKEREDFINEQDKTEADSYKEQISNTLHNSESEGRWEHENV